MSEALNFEKKIYQEIHLRNGTLTRYILAITLRPEYGGVSVYDIGWLRLVGSIKL